MNTVSDEVHHFEPPLAQMERALIDEFIRARGYDPTRLTNLNDSERETLLADASTFASGKLMEVEARFHFLNGIHDGTVPLMRH